MSNFLQIGATVLNSTHKDVASSSIDFYRHGDTAPFISNIMAVVSTLAEEMADMVFDGQTDNRRVDFIVSTADLTQMPSDGDYIIFNDIKYNCFQRDGQPHAGKYSDQFQQRFRIHTRRQGA